MTKQGYYNKKEVKIEFLDIYIPADSLMIIKKDRVLIHKKNNNREIISKTYLYSFFPIEVKPRDFELSIKNQKDNFLECTYWHWFQI
jgi:hypothetical protein